MMGAPPTRLCPSEAARRRSANVPGGVPCRAFSSPWRVCAAISLSDLRVYTLRIDTTAAGAIVPRLLHERPNARGGGAREVWRTRPSWAARSALARPARARSRSPPPRSVLVLAGACRGVGSSRRAVRALNAFWPKSEGDGALHALETTGPRENGEGNRCSGGAGGFRHRRMRAVVLVREGPGRRVVPPEYLERSQERQGASASSPRRPRARRRDPRPPSSSSSPSSSTRRDLARPRRAARPDRSHAERSSFASTGTPLIVRRREPRIRNAIQSTRGWVGESAHANPWPGKHKSSSISRRGVGLACSNPGSLDAYRAAPPTSRGTALRATRCAARRSRPRRGAARSDVSPRSEGRPTRRRAAERRRARLGRRRRSARHTFVFYRTGSISGRAPRSPSSRADTPSAQTLRRDGLRAADGHKSGHPTATKAGDCAFSNRRIKKSSI